MIKLRLDIGVPWTAELDSWLGLLCTATFLNTLASFWLAAYIPEFIVHGLGAVR
jgi:hypothetical protein